MIFETIGRYLDLGFNWLYPKWYLTFPVVIITIYLIMRFKLRK